MKEETYLEEMKSSLVVYMRRVGAYGIENNKLMERFKDWVKKNSLFNDEAVILGIALDDIRTVKTEDCRYDVCLVVKDDFKNDEETELRRIEGGKYLVMRIPHTKESVSNAWSMGIPKLINEGYNFDFSRLVIERYPKRLVDAGFCEICIPLF